MTYTANIVTVAEMQFMAGENVDATGDADANHIILQDMAEGYLSALLKYNLDAAGWGALDSTNKYLITEWAARFCGMQLILYNMAGFTTILEAEDMVNVHLYRMRQIEDILKNADIQQFQKTK